jgi:hypothetical protein
MARHAALVLLALAACDHSPRIGDACSQSKPGTCSGEHAALDCEAGHFVEVPCRGSAGCSVDESGARTCDVSQNLDGDPCARSTQQEHTGGCTPDHRMLVECHDGAFHRVRCDGPLQCSVRGDDLACDTLAAPR